MFKLKLGDGDALGQVLCIGAHSDDIEIGCGGTLLKLIDLYPNLTIYWVVLGANGQREQEAIASASKLMKEIDRKHVIVKGFRDGFFPYQGMEIKEYFEELKREVAPDLILTHYRDDRHQDHRLISDLTWNTFRDHLIWEYEIPKYDGDLGSPNVFIHLDEVICRRKIAHLFEHFGTQSNKVWFTEDTFYSILRMRGVESNAPDRYAEAFYCRKIVV
ncbi:PIG-L deacetylase family protein [Chamaesiphon polymorphus]|uniref:PIG-L domain-containing protein n=1 Tax=Chamaesiphon polymorphus CCALA 037 TaxID=2107692 RepID=A0A2T1G8Q2_9CYAN|nr:PIG-L deacetylase family protein [Chamaesiphon polymorphus]PSB53647.1 PIG-L domain-containing protein [Chamaesiphon polymorphus CCALA 037]